MGRTSIFVGILFIVLFFAFNGSVFAACPSASYVDSFSNLPPAPVFPADTLAAGLTPVPSASNPLTQDHWSEKANIGTYRPPKIVPVPNPAQTNCPHLGSGLKNWHDPATWGSAGVPKNGASVSIPAGTSVLISSCSIDPAFVFGVITIPATSKLIFADAAITIQAIGFNVQGAFQAGSATCRLRNKISITLHGKRGAQTLPAAATVKGMDVTGSIDIHGAQYFPTWSRLAMTAKAGDSYIFIQDIVNWQKDQTIVITTTELKDSRDWHRNEERKIVSVSKTTLGPNVAAIQLDKPLTYAHFGGREYQAEVSLLSRNIVFQGDNANSEPTDTATYICKDTNTDSTYPCENSYLTGFGAHIFINGAKAQGRFSGLELTKVGQTNVLGRYPIHYHLIGDLSSTNYESAYVQDSSVHKSYFRCYAIHGTSGVKLTQNTAYDAIGHCYFLEDGVEENNIWSYNQAAHIHPLGPYINPSQKKNGDDWGSQYLSWYLSTSALLLPSDMAAGCFYITNNFNDFFGNAASGGWAGYTMPALPLPVKLSNSVKDLAPSKRPFRSAFRGNSAHSTGFWWGTAGGIYVGGELNEKGAGNVLQYTSGRSQTRDTCADKKPGSCARANFMWLRFEDNKVFLANRGMQNWGNRAEIIRFELHNVGLSMNVFGQVYIDHLLHNCRAVNHRPTWFSGCSSATTIKKNTWTCANRDSTFWNTFGGFQWYDVGQQHILTNSEFRNCREDWEFCVNGPSAGICSRTAIFTSLTHSDEWVPEIMQITSGITYTNVGQLWQYTTGTTGNERVTTSGRLQTWIDADGSASRIGTSAMISSARANQWWRYNNNCVLANDAYSCPVATGDSAASIYLYYDSVEQAKIGNDKKTMCINGGAQKVDGLPCPIVARVTHFGRAESTGIDVSVNAKLTGPIINAAGGWFIRFAKGTPSTLTLGRVQLKEADAPLLLALPYPSGTTFTIYYQAPSWCSGTCTHAYKSVGSVSQVLASYGDAYYWDNAAKILYLRVIMVNNAFTGDHAKAVWTSYPETQSFSRGGHTLFTPSKDATIIIKSSCSGQYCAAQASVGVPAALRTQATLPTAPPATKGPAVPPPTAPPSDPTVAPSVAPTKAPTKAPTPAPTNTKAPTKAPTKTPTKAPTKAPTAPPKAKFTTAQIINEINAYRKTNKKAALKTHAGLTKVSADQAKVMATASAVTASPSLKSRAVVKQHYSPWTTLLENQSGVKFSSTAAAIVKAWAGKSASKANMLSSAAKNIACSAVASTKNGLYYIACDFGTLKAKKRSVLEESSESEGTGEIDVVEEPVVALEDDVTVDTSDVVELADDCKVQTCTYDETAVWDQRACVLAPGCVDATCKPVTSCAARKQTCGSLFDGCAVVECGDCATGEVCGRVEDSYKCAATTCPTGCPKNADCVSGECVCPAGSALDAENGECAIVEKVGGFTTLDVRSFNTYGGLWESNVEFDNTVFVEDGSDDTVRVQAFDLSDDEILAAKPTGLVQTIEDEAALALWSVSGQVSGEVLVATVKAIFNGDSASLVFSAQDAENYGYLKVNYQGDLFFGVVAAGETTELSIGNVVLGDQAVTLSVVIRDTYELIVNGARYPEKAVFNVTDYPLPRAGLVGVHTEGQATFVGLSYQSRVKLQVDGALCTNPEESRERLGFTLETDPANILIVCESRKRDLGATVYLSGTDYPAVSMSKDLATYSTAADASIAQNGLAVSSVQVVPDVIVAADAAVIAVEVVAAVAVAAVSVGVIAGVAAGGAVVVAGGATAGVMVYKKRKTNKKQPEVALEEAKVEEKPVSNRPKGAGANVFEFDPENHTSITARSAGKKDAI